MQAVAEFQVAPPSRFLGRFGPLAPVDGASQDPSRPAFQLRGPIGAPGSRPWRFSGGGRGPGAPCPGRFVSETRSPRPTGAARLAGRRRRRRR